jgi:hypothetical protein
MVITGAEPVLAATGADRGQWLEDVFVEPTDVRWDYLAVDDLDHTGAHSPLITDTGIDHAFRLLRELPATPAPPWHLMTDQTAEKGQDR